MQAGRGPQHDFATPDRTGSVVQRGRMDPYPHDEGEENLLASGRGP